MELYFGDERNHIDPQLGHYAMCNITTGRLQIFLNELQTRKHLSKRTIEHVRGTLVQMFDYAVESNIMSTNPARNTRVPRPKSRAVEEDENKVIPIDQRLAILKAMENEPIIRPIIIMLMFTGMRIGEALALR